jgi:ankyrin repeat protein
MAQELFDAIRENNKDKVAQLIAANPALARSRNEVGISALMQARYGFRLEIVDLLRNTAGELDVFEAATLGDVPRLHALLANDSGLAKTYSSDGFTALQLAAFFGQPAAVEALLQYAAAVNAVSHNPMKVAVINAAAASRNFEVVKLVLAAGANPDAQQQSGYTALHEAAVNNNAELAKALLSAGADPGIRSDTGRTAAEMAREKGHMELAEMLEARKPPGSG